MPDNKDTRELDAEVQSTEIAPYWLAAIIESADDAIISKTLDGIITSWNKGAERLFGYKAEEVVGKSVTILIPPDHQDEEPGILARIRMGERVEHYETVRIRKDGQQIDVSLTVSPIKGAKGNVIGASKIARDITEQKQTAARLKEALQQAREARKRAEEASRLKDEFLATISHELRTPMTAITGWAYLLRTGYLDDKSSAQALEAIDRNAKLQVQLINDLLDVSRFITGKLYLDVQPVELSSVIKAAIDVVSPAAQAKAIKIETLFDEDVEPVLGDPNRLQQVVWNLLTNSIKFTTEGGRVEVRLGRDRSRARITVTDTGIGISPEFLPHVFDRFRQADGSITRTHGGLGLGLSIVRHLVELHGGTVHADNRTDGQGAVFTVRLPLLTSQSEAGDSERLHSTDEARTALKDTLSVAGLRVLLVDDDADTLEMLTLVLKHFKADVTAATSAAEALEAIERWKPDVLVADIGLPGEDGYELIRKVRLLPQERGGGIQAVALTAYAGDKDRARAIASGYQMHLPKPIQPAELVATVATLARRTKEGI